MNWGAFESAIFSLNSYAWVWIVVLTCIANIRSLSLSTRIGLVTWAALDVVVLVTTPIVYNLHEVNAHLARVVWYPYFAFLSLTGLIFLHWLHSYYRIKKSELVKFIMLALLITIFVNIFRFFDRVIFETNALKPVYTYGIMSVKVMSALVFSWIVLRKERSLSIVY